MRGYVWCAPCQVYGAFSYAYTGCELRVPEKALSLVIVALTSLNAPRKRAMPRVTRPTQTIDLGMQPTAVLVWAGGKQPL